MANVQKDRYIQYLAGHNQKLWLIIDAMKLVWEDFYGSDEGSAGSDVVHAIETVRYGKSVIGRA